jgi:thioredoxin-like negative regulator of GroEL
VATQAAERDAPAARVGDLRLVFFHSETSGRCRRVEGFVAQVLQRRHNHETFAVVPVSQEQRPELFERFRIDKVPSLVVIEGNAVCRKLELPRSCRQIETFLSPWLR